MHSELMDYGLTPLELHDAKMKTVQIPLQRKHGPVLVQLVKVPTCPGDWWS